MNTYTIIRGNDIDFLQQNVNLYFLNNPNAIAVGGLYTYSQFNTIYFCQAVTCNDETKTENNPNWLDKILKKQK